MQINFLRTLGAILMAGCMLTSCHSDIDLGNVDPSAEVQMGLVLPVGRFRVTVGDFLGDADNIYIADTLDSKGLLVWRNTYAIERSFAKFNLEDYVTRPPQFSLNVYDNLQAKHAIGPDGKITGIGRQDTLHFAIPIKLEGVNSPDVAHRIDSALINEARFTSLINQHNLPLEWEWIDSVQLILGDRVRRPQGNTMTVYTKNHPVVSDYGDSIKTDVDAFTLNMMKNSHLHGKSEYWKYTDNNVVDSLTFYIDFLFTIPAGRQVTIPSDAEFKYDMKIEFIKYIALWGNFRPSDDMSAEAEEDLSESWKELEFLRTSSLPFSDPDVKANIYTQVAGAMTLTGKYLYIKDKDDVKHYATFNGSHERPTVTFYPGTMSPHSLDPHTSPIGAVSDDMWMIFNKEADKGCIDKLFYNMPQRIGYKFAVDFDYQVTPQIRVTPNDTIRVEADCRLPLIFNKGVRVVYHDTLQDVNLSAYTIDSLISDIKQIDSVKSSDIAIVMKVDTSTLQLPVKASMRCYDANGQIVMDPDSTDQPLLLFPADTVFINPPTFVTTGGITVPGEPGRSTIYGRLTKSKLDVLPQIKTIIWTAIIDDESMAYVFNENPNFRSRITKDEKLSIHIGLTANIDAYLNLNNKNDNNK